MTEENRKKLGEEWKATGKFPEYKKYWDEFNPVVKKEDYPEENINIPPEERKPKSKGKK